MKKYGSLKDLASLTLFLMITISTLSTPASSSANELVIYNPINQDQITILPGGMKICRNDFNPRVKTIFFGDTAYISVNQTVTLMFESACFKKSHSIMFHSKIWYNQKSWKNILVVEFTTDGLEIKSENKMEYSEKYLMEMNSELRDGGDCSNNMHINILRDRANDGWFMDKCDLDSFFEKRYVDLCDIDSGNNKRSYHNSMIQYSKTFSSLNEKIVIKPMSTKLIIKTEYCDEKVHITQYNASDFINDLSGIDEWVIFEYNVKKLIFSSNISISISGIQVDYWNYNELECDEEPKFTFIGAYDIKRFCINNYDDLIKVLSKGPEWNVNLPTESYDWNVNHTVYTTRRVINFPYLIIIIMIILGKAICGYGVYKRREARLISFSTRRIINNFEDVSSAGRNDITIVSSNQQSGSQSHSQRQPSEDLPPAYNDLQNTDSNPPGYEDACKNKFLSPPGYEDACKVNGGFQIDIETSTSRNEPEPMVVNQVSTNSPVATQR